MRMKRWIFPLLIFLLAVFLSMRALAQTNEPPLADLTFVIDSGHGGKDDGAQRNGVKEDEINLAIAKELCAQLVEQGANVILTRDDDYDLSDTNAENHKQEDLKQRVMIINSGIADYFISIHLNAYTSTKVQGAQVFYQEKNKESKAIAEQIQTQLVEMTNTKLSIKEGDYYILRKPSIPGVLVECGFLSNAQEREKLQEETYQHTIAEAIAAGVVNYIQNKS